MLQPWLKLVEAAKATTRTDLRHARVQAIPTGLTGAVYCMVAVLEPLIVFTLIMLYIWILRGTHPHLRMAILGLMLLSRVVRRESPSMLSFGTRGFRYRPLASPASPAVVHIGALDAGLRCPA
jgi:hypothetical protein